MKLASAVVIRLVPACIVLLGSAYAAKDAPACAKCHRAEAEMYAKSPMGRSMGPPVPLPGAKISHALSGSEITIEEREGQMYHLLSERGLKAEYPIAYQIGSGKDGYTYLVNVNGYLLESPASWYRPHGWDTSPGYQSMPMLDFDRPIDGSCLYCHADKAEFSDPDGHKFSGKPLTALGCDRCHGPGDEHARHPSAKNIVNPAKLPPPARDSICEQCHLEGAARVLNPGKRPTDFHPGQRLEEISVTYVPAQEGGISHAVSQVEQMARSKCVQGSGGRMWCATCHNPHKQVTDKAEVRATCETCHTTLSKAAHPAKDSDCVSCHMPRLSPDDIPHSATTDHRILRKPEPSQPRPDVRPDKIVAWREPSAEVRERDLALGELMVGSREQAKALSEAGTKLLNSLPIPPDSTDVELLTAVANNSLEHGNLGRALPFAKRAVEVDPNSFRAVLLLALALRGSGDLAGAERELRRATEINPTERQPWIELAKIYRIQKRPDELVANMERYLAWDPQNIAVRQQKANMPPASH